MDEELTTLFADPGVKEEVVQLEFGIWTLQLLK
jgi:hypothetical protein